MKQIKSADDISALVTFAKKEADAYEKEGIAGASNLIHRLLEELQNQAAVIAQAKEWIPWAIEILEMDKEAESDSCEVAGRAALTAIEEMEKVNE